MEKEPALYIKNLSFAYNRHPVLENVNLNLTQGSFISVIGPNGGGKTTLLKLILGLLSPTHGEIRVFGESPKKVRKQIGYVAQYSTFDTRFPVTAFEVVLMGRIDRNVVGGYSLQDKNKVSNSFETVGLTGLENIPFTELSGGQRQRVLIARALVTEPRMLLLDEPTSNIDVSIERKFAALLEDLRRDMTILLVTHDVGFASNLVEQVVCVNRTVVQHPTSSLTPDVINEIYGNRMKIIQHDKLCNSEER
jgi:zinc transport system ATP-binding protein